MVQDFLPHLVQPLQRRKPPQPRKPHADTDNIDVDDTDIGDGYYDIDGDGDNEGWRYDHIELVTFLIGASPSATTANITLGAQGLARGQAQGPGLREGLGDSQAARQGQGQGRGQGLGLGDGQAAGQGQGLGKGERESRKSEKR